MVEKAFIENSEVFKDDFKERIKAVIVQHHGKLEYGSPIAPRSEEAYIVHYADYVDATMNKINIISEDVPKGEWSPYDKRIGGRLYLLRINMFIWIKSFLKDNTIIDRKVT